MSDADVKTVLSTLQPHTHFKQTLWQAEIADTCILRVECDWGLSGEKTPQSYSTKSDSHSLYCLWKHHNLPCKQKVHLKEKAEEKKKILRGRMLRNW